MGDIAYYPMEHDRTEIIGGYRSDPITIPCGDTTGDSPVCEDCARRNPIGPMPRDRYGRFARRVDHGYYAREIGETDSPQNCDDCGIPLDFQLTTEGFRSLAEMCRDELRKGRDAYLAPMDGEWTPRYWRGSAHVEMLHSWIDAAGGPDAFSDDDARFIARFMSWTDPSRFQCDAHVRDSWMPAHYDHVAEWRHAARGGYFAV